MTAATDSAIQICSETVTALSRLEPERLEELAAQAIEIAGACGRARLSEPAPRLDALAAFAPGTAHAELEARVRLLGSLIRATGDNLRVLERVALAQAGVPAGSDLPWVD